jgi:hypothetical protein
MNTGSFLVIALAFLCACSAPNPSSLIVKCIEDECNKKTCIVDLGKIMPFTWDTFVYARYSASQEQLEGVFKIKFENFDEFANKLIFLKNGRLVGFENVATDIEGVVQNEVIFNIPDSARYSVYMKSQSIFVVQTHEVGAGVYYTLGNNLKDR